MFNFRVAFVEWGRGVRAEWNIYSFLGIGFVEVSSKVWGVDSVREDKYMAVWGCVSVRVCPVDCLFQRIFLGFCFVFW